MLMRIKLKIVRGCASYDAVPIVDAFPTCVV